jgi:hypothetical protein
MNLSCTQKLYQFFFFVKELVKRKINNQNTNYFAAQSMNRNIFLTFLAGLTLISYSPRIFSQELYPVDIETAKTFARNYCLKTVNTYTKSSKTALVLSLAETKTVRNNKLYYVFNINTKDGFIIMSADRNITPILCYVPHGTYSLNPELRPPAFNEWLEGYTNQIEYLLNNAVKNKQCNDLWSAYSSKGAWDSETMVLKITSKWNQGTFFNAYSPQTGVNGHPLSDPGAYGGRTPTGCVATAMGQIMYYYKWPLNGVGSHSDEDPANPNENASCGSADPSYGALLFNSHTSTYNFGAMVDVPNSINYEISRLLFNCAISVDMDFSYCVSWTNTWKAENAYRDYFNYDGTVDYILRSDYLDTWESIIIDQIRMERPVHYRGATTGMGHSWVCSGYQITSEAKLFWFNWGWGGFMDGFFNISSYPQYPFSSYNLDNGVIINIYPTEQPNLKIQSGSVSVDTIIPYENFDVNFNIANLGAREAGIDTVNCYLSTDATLDKDDNFLGSIVVPSLAIEQSINESIEDIAVGDESSGTYYILIEADTKHDVHESIENDNIYTITVQIENGPVSSVVISSPVPAVGAGNIIQNTTNNIIYRFDNSVTLNKAIISGLQIITSGTYVSADLANLKAWYSSDTIFSSVTDTLLSTKTASLGVGIQVFPGWTNHLISVGKTGYIFITADIPCIATYGANIYVNAVTSSDITFKSGTITGTTSAGGLQTFQYATPINVTNVSASVGDTQSLINWTNPTGCFDEIMIVAKALTPVTGSPSGDGSAYTANLAFGSGTDFDGGYVVYKGSVSSKTVNGLTNGTIYYFTFFTRRGTIWSSGINTNTTPWHFPEYRTVADGNWNMLNVWQYFNGSTWVSASSIPTSYNSSAITISNIVTIVADVSVDQVLVASGGKVIINNITLTIVDGTGDDFVVNGIVELTGDAGAITATGNLVFNSLSTYIHNRNAGSLPIATWAVTSECNITGIIDRAPTIPASTQPFGNFTWDCPGQHNSDTYISLAGQLRTIAGNFNVVSTGSPELSNDLRLGYTGSGDLTVKGNFLQTGGWFCITSGSSRKMTIEKDLTIEYGTFLLSVSYGEGILDVGGNFSSAGSFYFAGWNSYFPATLNVKGNCSITGTFNMSNTNKVGTLNVAGNFSHTDGTIISEYSGGSGAIVFNGTGTQIYTSGGTLSGTINFLVGSDTNRPTLQMGTGASPAIISSGSNGTFTLMDGTTLGITSAAGITTSDATGNIQVTGTRLYSSGANYIYNGATAQSTGSGLPATVNSLVYSNTGGVVTSTNAVTITNNFSITSGSVANLNTFTHTTGTLTLGGFGKPSGSYGHPSSHATYKNNTYFDAATGIVNNGCPDGTWLGETTDWHTNSNWSGNIPTSETTVRINSSTTNQPVISGSITAVCNSLTIGSGASLTINPGKALTVSSILTNYGTLSLKSDASGTASLIMGSYSDNGTENIELYLTGGGSVDFYKWHYISSPVSSPLVTTNKFTGNTLNLAQFVESLPVSAPPYNLQRGWIAFDNYSYYTQLTTGTPDYGFVALSLGKGYNYFDTEPYTYTFSGTLNTSAVSLSLSYSGTDNNLSGFNLLGNPFTCGLNWDAITFSGNFPSFTSTMIYYTHDNQSYTYQNGIGVPLGTTGHIPPMQGFFVKTNSGFVTGTTMPIPLAAREHNTTPRYKGKATLIPLIRLSITENEKSAETVVRFDNQAKSDLDLNFDAPRMFSSSDITSIYTTSGSTDFTINGLPFPDTYVVVPVIVSILKDGNHTISATQLQELGNYKVTLTDKLNNTWVDLKTVKNFTFASSKGLIKDRFILTVTNIVIGIEDQKVNKKPFNTYTGFNMIHIQTLADEWDGKTGSIKVVDLSGRIIRYQQNVEFRKGSIIQLDSPLTDGLYLIEIRAGIMKYVGKLVNK